MNETDELIESLLAKEEGERPRLVKAKYGFLPISIWNISGKPKPLDTFITDEIGRDSYSVSFQGQAKRNKKGVKSRLSQFHPEVARRCTLLWSKENDVMYDPFAERAPRILTANYLHRHAIGTDISEKFMRHNIKKIFGKEFPSNIDPIDIQHNGIMNGYRIELYCCDSRNVPFILNDSTDFIFCSPPYFTVEIYSNEENQLGYGKAIHGDNPDYQKFLGELKKVVEENFRVLKPGKYCVWVVADIRVGEEFLSFSSDTINLMKDVGFKHHDTAIYDVHSKSVLGIGKIVEKGYTAKSHEFILVFKKPEEVNIFG